MRRKLLTTQETGASNWLTSLPLRAKGFNLKKQEFGILSKQIGIDTIHVSEVDTQTTDLKYDPNIFYSSWSSNGFQEEARDLVQIVGEDNEFKNKIGFKRRKNWRQYMH